VSVEVGFLCINKEIKMGNSRRTLLKAATAVALSVTFGMAHAAWPERPINLVVPWGAGGGSDAIARMIGSLLEKDLGQPVNVINRTGGNGVVGHQAMASAKPDGYTLGWVTAEISLMHHQGLTQLSFKDYTPIALMNFDAAGLTVAAGSQFKDVNELVAYAKANPGKLKASGTGFGGIWHLATAGMLDSMKVDPNAIRWVPSNGASPALVDLAAGGVDILGASLPEGRSLVDANRATPLVVMSEKPSGLYPKTPTLKTATGSDWTAGTWRGVVGPKGLPADIQNKLAVALEKIYSSKEYQSFMEGRGFGVQFAAPVEFEKFWVKNDADMGNVLKKLGMAK
jgi:tripartite-type tricarboxylate transporter receptor subunit TctC